jgi:hypothetical protein
MHFNCVVLIWIHILQAVVVVVVIIIIIMANTSFKNVK